MGAVPGRAAARVHGAGLRAEISAWTVERHGVHAVASRAALRRRHDGKGDGEETEGVEAGGVAWGRAERGSDARPRFGPAATLPVRLRADVMRAS